MAQQLTDNKTLGVKRPLDTTVIAPCTQPKHKKRRLCGTYLDEDELTECTRTIHTTMTVSYTMRKSVPMSVDIASAARKYYLHIVNNANTTFPQKKDKIYNDLVMGSKSNITLKEEELKKRDDSFEVKFQIGLNNQEIKSIKSSIVTFGRFTENDICSNIDYESISRVQCFIFIIDDSLIVMDSWSLLGTKTMKVNDKKGEEHSLPKKRMLLRFNKHDTIHLRFGEDPQKVDLIINPKECVICMDKARVIRNSCGHYALCRDCYEDLLTQTKAECPICRASIKSNPVLTNASVATFAGHRLQGK